MASFQIPPALIQMLAEQRVIPFIGAGFSAALDLPQWDSLLGDLAEEIQRGGSEEDYVPYTAIREACNGDYLQIAEYLFLRAGETIGPLRHALDSALRASSPTTTSTAHVELVNLCAAQVYTTNFDDLIETTYHALDQPVSLISVARDVALADPQRTHVVKYHGDLRHEHTLVLTESQYYTRLEFESPMDLKLRADLLGRSVLFLGYSFSDINLRVIWFRLMQTMKEVPEKDRLPSYIVRLRSNPVLEQLYEAVGLTTIVIDPDEQAASAEAETKCLANFMLRLTMEVGRSSKSRNLRRMFVSGGLLDAIDEELTPPAGSPRFARIRSRRVASAEDGGPIRPEPASTDLVNLITRLTDRQIPSPLQSRCEALIDKVATSVHARSTPDFAARIADWILDYANDSPGATLLVSAAMSRAGTRKTIFSRKIPWEKVWAAKLGDNEAAYLLELFGEEVDGHLADDFFEDDDVAYLVDIAKRIENGSLLKNAGEPTSLARQSLERLSEVYPSVGTYEPPPNGKPNPTDIINEIADRIASNQGEDNDEDEEE